MSNGFVTRRIDMVAPTLREDNSPGYTGLTVDRYNMRLGTTEDNFPEIAPFMRRNIAQDRPRRNYYIAPGGRARFLVDPSGEVVETSRVYDGPVTGAQDSTLAPTQARSVVFQKR